MVHIWWHHPWQHFWNVTKNRDLRYNKRRPALRCKNASRNSITNTPQSYPFSCCGTCGTKFNLICENLIAKTFIIPSLPPRTFSVHHWIHNCTQKVFTFQWHFSFRLFTIWFLWHVRKIRKLIWTKQVTMRTTTLMLKPAHYWGG